MRDLAELWGILDVLYEVEDGGIDDTIMNAFYDGIITWDEAVMALEFLDEQDEE